MRRLRAFALMLVTVVLCAGSAYAQAPGAKDKKTIGTAEPAPGKADASKRDATGAPATAVAKPDPKATSEKPKADAPADPKKASPGSAAATASSPASSASVPGATSPGSSAGAPAASGAPAPATTAEEPVDGSTYVVRMRDLAQRIDELKEQIRRSHTRLSLLSDTILSGGVGGARAEIRFGNDMSTAFRLTRLVVVLDGAVQYNRQDDTGALSKQKEIPIFSGSVPPGDHTLQVLVKLQGYGYGVFSYLRGYSFEVKSSHSFTVTAGKTVELQAIAFEKGGVTTPLEQRPAMRFVQNLRSTGAAEDTGADPVSGPSSGKVSGSLSVGAGGH